MKIRRPFLRAVASAVLLVAGILLPISAFAATGQKPVSINDLLEAEGLGATAFSPDGKWLLFVRAIPPAQQPSWSYDDPGFVRQRVFVGHSDGRDVREIPNSANVHYRPAFGHYWSPDGRGLMLVATRRDGYGLAYYDMASGRSTALPGRIAYGRWAWAPDGRVLYQTMADGQRQVFLYAPLLDGLSSRWRAAWNGHVPQVTVSSSGPVFPSVEPPQGDLMIADPRTGAAKGLARGNFEGVSASPDGRTFAVLRQAEDLPDAVNGFGKRAELQIFVMSAGGARLLYRDLNDDLPETNDESLSWSPSGKQLIFIARPVRDEHGRPIAYGRDLQSGTRLFEMDLDGLKLRRLSGDDLFHSNWESTGGLPIGWMGGRPVAVASHHVVGAEAPADVTRSSRLDYGQSRDTRLDLFVLDGHSSENLTAFAKSSVNRFIVPTGRDFALVVADGALWKLAPGKAAQRLSPVGAPSIAGFGIDRVYPEPDSDAAYYRSGSVERISLATVDGRAIGRGILDLTSGKLTPVAVSGDIVATAPDQTTTMSKTSTGWMSTLTLDNGASHILATFNAALKDRALIAAQSFTYEYDGKPLTGWVICPPGAKPLPAVVSVYGGSVFGSEPPFFAKPDVSLGLFSGQLLAGEGYAVIYPSTPLGPGSDTNMMSTLADEVIAAVDALAAKGVVDPRRVGIMGQSFGGFSTAAVLSERSDRFRAGVSMAGIYDFIHGYGLRSFDEMLDDDSDMIAPEMMMIESRQARLGKPFWDAPDAYMRNSPIFRADALDAPLLLLHGDLDMAVTGLSGAERLYNALLRAGKHPTLVRYWGEGHVAADDWAIRDQWMRITTWFAHYLRGAK